MICCCVLQVVQEYERAVIFRLGRLRPGGARGPGIFFVIPCIDSYKKVDLRTVSFDVPPQEVGRIGQTVLPIVCDHQVLSRDSVTVTVDAVIYFRVSNPTMVSLSILCVGIDILSLGYKQCGGFCSLHPPTGSYNSAQRAWYQVLGTDTLREVQPYSL